MCFSLQLSEGEDLNTVLATCAGLEVKKPGDGQTVCETVGKYRTFISKSPFRMRA